MWKSIEDVKAANAKSTQPFWFDEATMEFFRTEVETPLCHDHFVTSEEGMDGVRKYTVRQVTEEAHIKTVGDFQGFTALPEAVAAMKGHVLGVAQIVEKAAAAI